MSITDDGKYLLQVCRVIKYAYGDAEMEMAVWVDKRSNMTYNYFITINIPRILEVLL